MTARPVTYTVVSRVVEIRRTGVQWMAWAMTGPEELPDDDEALQAFLRARRTRHDECSLEIGDFHDVESGS